MITDKETNLVYFSRFLREYPAGFYGKLEEKLIAAGINFKFLSYSSKDQNVIWCKDYMPIQISENEFVQFNYDPCYLRDTDKAAISRATALRVCRAKGIKPKISNIRIDGGNIVKSRTKVIMTDRIFCENPQYKREKLIRELKATLKVRQIIIIPQCPDDPFGHADGMIRFIDGVKDEKMVFVNDYNNDFPDFKKQLYVSLKEAGLKIVLIPYNLMSNDEMDASGIYINYLQVGRMVLYPDYGIKEDLVTHKIFTRYFGAPVFPVRANLLAKEGGILNCASWNLME